MIKCPKTAANRSVHRLFLDLSVSNVYPGNIFVVQRFSKAIRKCLLSIQSVKELNDWVNKWMKEIVASQYPWVGRILRYLPTWIVVCTPCHGKLTTLPQQTDISIVIQHNVWQQIASGGFNLSSVFSVSGKNAGVPKELSTLADDILLSNCHQHSYVHLIC